MSIIYDDEVCNKLQHRVETLIGVGELLLRVIGEITAHYAIHSHLKMPVDVTNRLRAQMGRARDKIVAIRDSNV